MYSIVRNRICGGLSADRRTGRVRNIIFLFARQYEPHGTRTMRSRRAHGSSRTADDRPASVTTQSDHAVLYSAGAGTWTSRAPYYRYVCYNNVQYGLGEVFNIWEHVKSYAEKRLQITLCVLWSNNRRLKSYSFVNVHQTNHRKCMFVMHNS